MVFALIKASFRIAVWLPLLIAMLMAGCSIYEPNLLNPIYDAAADQSLAIDSSIADTVKGDAESGADIVVIDSSLDGPTNEADVGSDVSDAHIDSKIDSEIDSEIDSNTDAECVPDPKSNSGEDCCPDDPSKTEPGICGCGTPDSDKDSDGVADCLDECPDDPKKTEPGTCGCGTADDDTGCIGLKNALIHRYRFEGTGTTAVDSVGDDDGTVTNTQLGDTGSLDLAGGATDQYLDLPNPLISVLTDASFEVWIVWKDSSTWERIFDFGSSDAAEGTQGSGKTYLYLCPKDGLTNSNKMRLGYSENGNGANETALTASIALPAGTSTAPTHVVAVIDDTNDKWYLYINGVADPAGGAAFPTTGHLSKISDVNNWIGRSQYIADAKLNASVYEFRIYNVALSAAQVQMSYTAGPDPSFLE
jgi:hypothetical protein